MTYRTGNKEPRPDDSSLEENEIKWDVKIMEVKVVVEVVEK